VNEPDVVDVYEETFDSAQDPLSYRSGGQCRKAVEWAESIGVKTGSGIATRRFTMRKTHHGPIVA
jgi:acyl-homoserine-lactone acylase